MKRTALLAVLLLVTIAGCGRMPGLHPELSNLPEGGTTVPMRIAANRPLVEVYLNDKGPYTFLLDTGCTYVFVSQRISDELGLKEWQTHRVQFQTNTGKYKGQTTWARLEILKLGELELKQFDVAMKIADSILVKTRCDGILGIKVLEQWLLTIDYPAKQVTITQGQLPAPDNQTAFGYKSNGTPEIPVTIGDHTKLMEVDTGSTGAFSLPKDWEEQLHFTDDPDKTRASGMIGSIEVLAGRVSEEIRFGVYSFTEPTVDVGGMLFLVGGSVLKNFRITLDQQKKIIRLESPKKFPLKLPPHCWAKAKDWPGCVEDWISEGQDVDATDHEEHTALFMAAYQGHTDAVTKLLEAGGDVNFTIPVGATPLIATARAGHEGMVKVLLKNGADLSARTACGQDALFFSAANGHVGCTSLLLSNGAKIETQDKQGLTAMMIAAWEGHERVVRFLLDAGANPNHQDNEKHSVLIAAAQQGHSEIVKLLLGSGTLVNLQGKGGVTALHVAAFNGRLEVARMLVDKGANVNLPTNKNYTPLMSAAKGGHIEAVKLLLDKGAEPSTRDTSGKTALDYAIEKKNDAVVQLLTKIAGTQGVGAYPGVQKHAARSLALATRKN